MLSKDEITILESIINRCYDCEELKRLKCCPDCYIDRTGVYVINKLYDDFKKLESDNQKSEV